MNTELPVQCPECLEPIGAVPSVDRRRFLGALGGAAILGLGGSLPRVLAADAPAKAAGPAESLIIELFSTLSPEQVKAVVLPMSDKSRIGTANGALKGQTLGGIYTKPQQELVRKILRGMLGSDEAYSRVSRNNTWDNTKSFENLGFHIFGEPAEGKAFTGLVTGHHLTLRCDSDLKDGVAWGGPVYYGHSANGYADTNVYLYQTKAALEVFRSLDDKQKAKAVVAGDPGDGQAGIRARKADEAKPGIAFQDLNKEQLALVDILLKDVLSLFRKEDGDEVLSVVKANGGTEKIHLAFYRDKDAGENERYHYWRLEGPGFIWNYRVLPHVHCYVNIATPTA